MCLEKAFGFPSLFENDGGPSPKHHRTVTAEDIGAVGFAIAPLDRIVTGNWDALCPSDPSRTRAQGCGDLPSAGSASALRPTTRRRARLGEDLKGVHGKGFASQGLVPVGQAASAAGLLPRHCHVHLFR